MPDARALHLHAAWLHRRRLQCWSSQLTDPGVVLGEGAPPVGVSTTQCDEFTPLAAGTTQGYVEQASEWQVWYSTTVAT